MPFPQQKRFDPLEILPDFFGIAIIAESASKTRPGLMDPGTEVFISQDSLLDLMQVSRLWSVRISSSAMLWVNIVLEDEYDAAAKAFLALHYSKQAPLTLYMHYPTGWWDTLQEQIMANRARITRLFIYNHYGSSFIDPVLRQLSPLPSLAGLYYRPLLRVSEVNHSYLSDSPITWADLWLDRGGLQEITTWDLRKINLECELSDVFDLLEGSENLQEVIVLPRVGAWDEQLNKDVEDTPLQGSPLPWKYITYHSLRSSFLAATIARLPKLIELRIFVSQSLFCSLMPLIFQLENLSIFEMTLRGQWDRFERLVIPRASTSVRDAGIWIESDTYPVMEPVIDALFQCLANIRLLQLEGCNLSTIRMLIWNTDIHYPHTIWIDVVVRRGDTWFDTDGAIEPLPASVERVSYRMGPRLLKPVIPLQSHHTKHLEISCFSLSEMDLYSQRWTAICTINVGSNTIINWKGPSYQHLHTISFKTISSYEGSRAENGTKLCRDIALHAEYFPALSKLEFDICPELDILFILIETRNAATRPGISPITTLVIPTRCPPFLVERLRDLVKGIRHGGSNYYELSIAGNYDIITDGSITGCFACHRALRFCTEPPNPRGAWAYFSTIVMEYPESVTEILESWDMRAEKWYRVERKQRSRGCQRSFPLVSITR